MVAVVRVQVVDLHEAKVAHAVHLAFDQTECRVVDLHVAGLGNDCGGQCCGSHAVDVVRYESDGFLDEQMAAGLEDAHGDIDLRIGLAQKHRRQRLCEEGVEAGVPVVDAILLGGATGEGRREITDGDDVKLVTQKRQVRQVLDLSHGATTDDADTDSLSHLVLPARGDILFHCSAISKSLSKIR